MYAERVAPRQQEGQVAHSMNSTARWLLATAVLSFQALGCQGRSTASHDEVIGLWTTTSQLYQERAFEITENRLYLGIGEGEFKVHPIHGVKVTQEHGTTLYTFRYSNAGVSQQLSLRLHPKGYVTFGNRNNVFWNRAEPGSSRPWAWIESGDTGRANRSDADSLSRHGPGE